MTRATPAPWRGCAATCPAYKDCAGTAALAPMPAVPKAPTTIAGALLFFGRSLDGHRSTATAELAAESSVAAFFYLFRPLFGRPAADQMIGGGAGLRLCRRPSVKNTIVTHLCFFQ